MFLTKNIEPCMAGIRVGWRFRHMCLHGKVQAAPVHLTMGGRGGVLVHGVAEKTSIIRTRHRTKHIRIYRNYTNGH